MTIGWKKRIFAAAIVMTATVSALWGEAPYQAAWTTQIGTDTLDQSVAAAADTQGNSYVTGYTNGDLGDSNEGYADAFLSKFAPDGSVSWTKLFGTETIDDGHAVATDLSNNVYVAGNTTGDLGGTNAGNFDTYLRKWDSNGQEVWMTQVGGAGNDLARSVAVDASGNAYVSGVVTSSSGTTNVISAIVRKFDSNGQELWSTYAGIPRNDYGEAVALDASGAAYVTGYFHNDSNRYDAYLAKIDSSGNKLWDRRMGTEENDQSYAVAVDSAGDVYISGTTLGSLGGPSIGYRDAFVVKFDSDGQEIWRTQLGTPSSDESRAIVIDVSDNIYISGQTSGDFGGANAGEADAFIAKLNSDGNTLWVAQVGTSETDAVWGMAIDGFGDPYITGDTRGDFGGPNAGSADVFLTKFETPEPATMIMMAAGLPMLLRIRRRRS
jgi:hypothetical protein